MNLERQLQLTEKALSIDWCIQNLVLIDSIVFARNDSKFVKIFVSDPGHIEILGDFIASRLQAKCNLNPDFEVADKKNIEIVLAQLKFLKEREADKDLNNILRKTESKNQNKSPTTKSRPEALDLNSNNFNRDYRIQLEAKETTGTGEKKSKCCKHRLVKQANGSWLSRLCPHAYWCTLSCRQPSYRRQY